MNRNASWYVLIPFIWLFFTVFVPIVIMGVSSNPKQLPIVTSPS